jgi:hypothetical protein
MVGAALCIYYSVCVWSYVFLISLPLVLLFLWVHPQFNELGLICRAKAQGVGHFQNEGFCDPAPNCSPSIGNCFRASPPLLSMWPCENVSHIQVKLFTSLQTQPQNWKGDYKYVGTTHSKQPGPIIMFGQSKAGSTDQIIFITLFSSMCTALLHLLPASANCAYMQEQNRFAELNQHLLTFLHLILMCRVIYWAWGMLLWPFSFQLTLLVS